MVAPTSLSVRHPAEAELLTRAVRGEPKAVDSLLSHLLSTNHWLRQIIMEAIQDCADTTLWQRLLACLALHQWPVQQYENEIYFWDAREVSRQIDSSLIELFVTDDNHESAAVKQDVLHERLNDDECRVRTAAAILLGLRGDDQVIDTLIETMRSGELECQLRTIDALVKLKDARGGDVLIEALASDNDSLHQKASEALAKLGNVMLPSFLKALENPKPHVRWHAVGILAGMTREKRAAAGLANALDDPDYGVRWAASDVLAQWGDWTVPTILERLSRHTLSDGARQAAYHALHKMALTKEHQERLHPLLEALNGPAAFVEAPGMAFHLLQLWERDRE